MLAPEEGLGVFRGLRDIPRENIRSMVLDISTSEEVLGTYTGLYYVAGTLAAVVGPILNGWVIDLTGCNYNMIFPVTPGFFVLKIIC